MITAVSGIDDENLGPLSRRRRASALVAYRSDTWRSIGRKTVRVAV